MKLLPWNVVQAMPRTQSHQCLSFSQCLFPVGTTNTVQERVAARHFGRSLRHQVMMGKAHAIQDGGQATSPEQDGRVDTVGLRLLVDLVGLTDQGRLGARDQQPLGSEEWWWTR